MKYNEKYRPNGKVKSIAYQQCKDIKYIIPLRNDGDGYIFGLIRLKSGHDIYEYLLKRTFLKGFTILEKSYELW